ncbi:TatD family hydrolase [Candidatus Bathyarchaeota archaeon]|nr:TatD family hydrolase [Candidatus Bathyarchaeota archaeon]
MMKLIDTHAHLEDIEPLDEALTRAEQAGVTKIITMGVDRKSNQWALNESSKHARLSLKIYPALGIHPSWIDEQRVDADLEFIEENISKIIAVGEIGLDYWYKTVRKDEQKKNLQRETFRRLLEVVKKHKKPVSIHSRGAWTDCVDIAIEIGVEKAVFHWFTGSLKDLKKLLDKGYYVSATPALSYSKEHKSIIENTPLDRILLETDSPVMYQGESSEPSHVLKALYCVAELKKEKNEIVAQITTENAKKVFGF